MDFEEALSTLGFRLGEQRAFGGGARLYESHPNAFTTYTVQAFDDGTAIFSWSSRSVSTWPGADCRWGPTRR